VLYTHAHADHILGIDDLRFINILRDKNIKILGREETLNNIKDMFSYIFECSKGNVSKPDISTDTFQDETKILNGISIEAVSIDHDCMMINGYIIENKVAYLTDFKRAPDVTIKKIKGIDYLILGCVYYDSHPNHLSYDEAMNIIKIINPKKTYLTHTSHIFEYDEINKKTPPGIEMGFDGLSFCIN
jgi:phosphoribosyl 1,2-cyclic phosphate phosphodiesterase